MSDLGLPLLRLNEEPFLACSRADANHSCRETWSWDVRTKHVTYEPVPTVEDVRALASYGPTATLFTLGPNYTVQQYDLEHQQMVANVQHLPTTVPPTPPEENRQLGMSASESEEDVPSPIRRANHEISAMEAARIERTQSASPRSGRSRTDSLSSRTSSLRGRVYEAASPAQRTERSGTTFSLGIQSQISKDPLLTSSSLTYPSSANSPASTRSMRKGSRLKQEILPSPEDKPIRELFPYIRARLSDVPYKPIRQFDESRLTPDDLRRQMLNVVFGWEEDIEDLIRDECELIGPQIRLGSPNLCTVSRHPMGSQNAVLLSKWLNDDPDHMAAMIGVGGTPSSMDWMMLALSGLGNQAQTKKIGQAFVEKMLARGDVHAAATILLSLGDEDDAIEVYVTRHHFMEAILLTCLLRPTDWQRQSFLVRRWGEHVVENAQQHLAIRCFSCTGVEPSEPWTSPTAQRAVNFLEHASVNEEFYGHQVPPSRRKFLEAPTPIAMPAPPAPFKHSGPLSRMTTKNSSLKLITSFTPPSQGNYKFPGLKSDDRTPTNAPGVTPIAESAVGESAVTPGGLGSYRLNSARSMGNSFSGRTATPGGYARQRLPSIGETPIDVTPPTFPTFQPPKPLPTPDNSGSDKEKETSSGPAVSQSLQNSKELSPVLLLSSARYEAPTKTPKKDTPLTAVAPSTIIKFHSSEMLPSPHLSGDPLKGESNSRNGSRTRKPEGLSIQMVPVQETRTEDYSMDPVLYAQSYKRSDTAGSYTTTQIDTQSEMTSPPTTGNSYRTLKSPSVSGKSIDQYISSLEQAQFHTKAQRSQPHSSRDRHGKDENHERKRSKHRQAAAAEDDRGRKSRRVIPSSKRSPSSPVPMSPEDLHMYGASVESLDSMYNAKSDVTKNRTRDRSNQSRSTKIKVRSESKTGERHRHRSTSRHGEGKSRASSRAVSRRRTPEPAMDAGSRGRQESRREGSRLRSPSSPIPMSASGEDLRKNPDSDRALRLVSHDRQRVQRSKSRRPERGTSAVRDVSPDRRKPRTRSRSRQARDLETEIARKSSVSARAETPVRDPYQTLSLAPHADLGLTSMPRPVAELANDPLYTALYSEASSTPQLQSLSDRRRKEIAAAELEARRLSLARRPSVPEIPLPGHLAYHSKSHSVGASTPPPLQRAHTETLLSGAYSNSFIGRMIAKHSPTEPTHSDSGSSGKGSSRSHKPLPGTPRAMKHPEYNANADAVPEIPDSLPTLSGSVYLPQSVFDIQRSSSAPVPEHAAPPPFPVDLPMHPAYDWRLPTSRANSKTRERDFSPNGRASSRERTRISPREPPTMVLGSTGMAPVTNIAVPPVLPELQHLAAPPPPPPPPAIPHHLVMSSPLSVVSENPDQIEPSTSTGFPEPPPIPHHRRGRSGNDNFVDKIRSITGRLRSTSRGRNTQSPPSAASDNPSPYESLPIQAFQTMNVGANTAVSSGS